jgi:hypothetical protein
MSGHGARCGCHFALGCRVWERRKSQGWIYRIWGGTSPNYVVLGGCVARILIAEDSESDGGEAVKKAAAELGYRIGAAKVLDKMDKMDKMDMRDELIPSILELGSNAV